MNPNTWFIKTNSKISADQSADHETSTKGKLFNEFSTDDVAIKIASHVKYRNSVTELSFDSRYGANTLRNI